MVECFLSDAEKGVTYLIEELMLNENDRLRFEEMGIQQGEKIVCLCAAPKRSPILFWINGMMIALRNKECQRIKVKELTVTA